LERKIAPEFIFVTAMCTDFMSSLGAVILFVLRVLKVADFQPRIALVTRTLGNSFIDLIHFFALFGVILLGYCIAGVLLFGHQYEGFSTLQLSIFNLLIMLIAWNPGDSWVQVISLFKFHHNTTPPPLSKTI
jgi:hypothetical protein